MKFKRFLCYFLATLLTVFVVSSANYKSVHAFEWVSGALAFSEALTWVLASLGITTVVGDYTSEVDMSRHEFWQSYEQEFYDYVDAHQGNTASDRFIEWKNKICKGIVDKSSEYWSMFKEWALSLTDNSGGSGSNDNYLNIGFYSGMPLGELVTNINNQFNKNYDMSSSLSSYQVYAFWYYPNYNLGGFIINNRNFYINGSTLRADNNDSWFECSLSGSGIRGPSSSKDSVGQENGVYISYNINTENSTITTTKCGGGSQTVINNYFQSATGVNENTDIVSRIGEEEDEEVKIKYPGLEDSDDSVSEDIYDNIINEVNEGTKTIDDAIEEIQGILGVIAYDDVTDDVIPNKPDPDTGGNKKKEDVIKENKNNMTFTLAGLENIFPFCIPWDIYSFITILEAEPDAPDFDFPIKSVNNQTENIHVDLSPFEPVAVVVRYIFDFLFIIGLALLTRSLIGAGGGD